MVSAPKPSPNGEFPLQSFGSGMQSSNGGNPLIPGHQVSSSSLLMGANSLLNNSGRTNFTNKQLTELEKVTGKLYTITRMNLSILATGLLKFTYNVLS